MAIEWLLAKSLIVVQKETVTPIASLTKVGEVYFDQHSPIERVLSAAREAGQPGARLTIQDIQAKSAPNLPKSAQGRRHPGKKEGAILIVQGGCIEGTGRPSPTAETMRSLLQELRAARASCRVLRNRCGRCCSSIR
ncbi:MAG: hypothetical protein U0361_12065 [Nitrospiraceae bacterium]